MIRAAFKKEQAQGGYHYGYRLIKRMDKSINWAVGNLRQMERCYPARGEESMLRCQLIASSPRSTSPCGSQWEHGCPSPETRRL